MLTDAEIIAAVSDLNGQIYDKAGNECYAFTATFDGTNAWIQFLGNTIWRFDEDERTYDEESDTYEPLTDFLQRSAFSEVDTLAEWQKASIVATAS